MSVICVGTMAFDAIETPFGKVDRIVGGLEKKNKIGKQIEFIWRK